MNDGVVCKARWRVAVERSVAIGKFQGPTPRQVSTRGTRDSFCEEDKRGTNLEHRSTNGYIFLGITVRYLMDVQSGWMLHAGGGVADNVADLQTRLDQYEFFVTREVGWELWELREGWLAELAEHEGDEQWTSGRLVSDKEFADIRRISGVIRETLLAESRGKVAYIASDKRYTVSKLIGSIGSLMGKSVYDALPDLAKYDFEEGGKAIAFDLPTAAAFHILRGTEAVLRDFYERVVRRDRIAEPRMWAAMVADMRKKSKAPPASLLDNLDSLRKHYRNPTQHPEKVYDSDEVQDLLALAVDSVNRMVAHLISIGR